MNLDALIESMAEIEGPVITLLPLFQKYEWPYTVPSPEVILLMSES